MPRRRGRPKKFPTMHVNINRVSQKIRRVEEEEIEELKRQDAGYALLLCRLEEEYNKGKGNGKKDNGVFESETMYAFPKRKRGRPPLKNKLYEAPRTIYLSKHPHHRLRRI